jgi:lysophospholipid acyltransferase (LPLAT)-like uncharacterized protein
VNKQKDENLEKAFEFAGLGHYPRHKRLMVRAIAWIAYRMIGLFARTIRLEITGEEHRENIAKEGRQPIYAIWHDRIFLGTYFLRKSRIVAMTSQSFDGEYIARLIQLQGNGAVRGSSTRGGVKGLVEMIRLAKNGLATCFIVDGPKGPRYLVKEGAVMLAKKSGNPALPLLIEAKHFWTLNSWDKMQIPRPFTKARVFIAEPVYVSADADNTEVQNKQQELQKALDALVSLGEQWRAENN